jgi:ribosomal protein S27E
MTLWRMPLTSCIYKATDTHSEYLILSAVPLRQWLYERASMLCYYVHCPSCITRNEGYVYSRSKKTVETLVSGVILSTAIYRAFRNVLRDYKHL